MPAPTIYYIRHGETDWNASGRLQGVQDVALNGRGIEQAIHVGAVLEDLFARAGAGRPVLCLLCDPARAGAPDDGTRAPHPEAAAGRLRARRAAARDRLRP